MLRRPMQAPHAVAPYNAIASVDKVARSFKRLAPYHGSNAAQHATIAFRQSLDLFLPRPGLRHARSTSHLGNSAGTPPPPTPLSRSSSSFHVQARHSLGPHDIETLAQPPLQALGPVTRAVMAFSTANSSGVPGTNAQTNIGPEIAEIAVEVGPIYP
jgi:hypothetical protein